MKIEPPPPNIYNSRDVNNSRWMLDLPASMKAGDFKGSSCTESTTTKINVKKTYFIIIELNKGEQWISKWIKLQN